MKMHTYINNNYKTISFDGCYRCAFVSKQNFKNKPGKEEVEYDVVQDIGEW